MSTEPQEKAPHWSATDEWSKILWGERDGATAGETAEGSPKVRDVQQFSGTKYHDLVSERRKESRSRRAPSNSVLLDEHTRRESEGFQQCAAVF